MTIILIAVNFYIFLAMMIDRLSTAKVDELAWGANWGPFTLSGQWWRLLTSAFLHANAGHLLGNLLILGIIGECLEQVWGGRTFLLFYLGCSLAGSLTSLAVHPEKISLGASAGIFGLAGGLISVYGMKGLAFLKNELWKPVALVAWTAFSIYQSAGMQGIDNAAHAGGLIWGLIAGAFLASRLGTTIERRRWFFAGMAALLVLTAVSARHYYRAYVIPLDAANRAMREGRTNDALRAVAGALEKKSDSSPANVMAARIYLEQRDYPKAESAARRAWAADPKNNSAAMLLFSVAMQSGRYCQTWPAAVSFSAERTAIKAVPAPQCDCIVAGDRLFREKKFDEAINAYGAGFGSELCGKPARLGLDKAFQAKEMQKEGEDAAAKAAQTQKQDQ